MAPESKSDAPIFLVGATGTGKSAAAMEVARDSARAGVGTAILCMDAMQVYRGADIGTSKPSPEERAEIPHGGLDLVDFGAAFDVAQYLRHAATFLREQRAAGRRVIVVGGTGLYFRALTRGLCEAPQGSDTLRAELAALSVEALRARLRRVDPAMLERVDAANPRRLARAIEVMEASGKSLRAWQEETPKPVVREFTAFWIQREKAELEERIAARVEAMFFHGWVEEVRGLVERFGLEAVRRFPGIGYGEIAEGMQDQISKLSKFPNSGEEASTEGVSAAACALRAPGQRVVWATGGEEGREAFFERNKTEGGREAPPLGTAAATGEAAPLKGNILVATRQYAKRQLTWFAREPSLQKVMFTGNLSLSEALRVAGAAHCSDPNLL